MTPERRLLNSLARVVETKVVKRVARLMRTLGPDAGSFGANLWEDVCVQVQGDESAVWHLYQDQVSHFVRGDIEQLTDLERELLWIQTDNGWDWAYDHFGSDVNDPIPTAIDDIVAYVAQEVMNHASNYTNARIEKLLEREHD